MKVIIFGGTGTVGRQLVNQGLEQGHEVTAFARKPQALQMDHPGLTLFAGDVLDPKVVQAAVHGHDAVFIALGAGRKGGIRSIGTQHIVQAMATAGIARLVCQTTLGAGDSRPLLNFFWKRLMFGFFLKKVYEDHQDQERIIKQSKLDWTIIRPAAFTNGPASGSYKYGQFTGQIKLKLKISQADLASFMLQQLGDNTWLHKTPALSY